MEAKIPAIIQLAPDNGHEWILSARSALLVAGVYDLIEEPWDFSGENDKWLRVGHGNGVTSSQAQAIALV